MAKELATAASVAAFRRAGSYGQAAPSEGVAAVIDERQAFNDVPAAIQIYGEELLKIPNVV